MEASILITVKNDRDNLNRLLLSLEKQNLNEMEIVIVDAYSSDGTFDLIKNFSKRFNNIVYDQIPGSRGKGRNRCIQLSRGEQLIFLDSDTEVPDGWSDKLREYYSKPIVAGKVIQRSDARWSDLGRVPMMLNGVDVTYPSNNLKYSRKVIDEIGLFDDKMNTAEDIDLNIRAVQRGYSIYYAEDMFVYHYPRENIRGLIRQSYEDGIGRKYIHRKYGLRSQFNFKNLKNHFFIESLRLGFGMIGYLFGDFHD